MIVELTYRPRAQPNRQAQENKGNYLVPQRMDGFPESGEDVFDQKPPLFDALLDGQPLHNHIVTSGAGQRYQPFSSAGKLPIECL